MARKKTENTENTEKKAPKKDITKKYDSWASDLSNRDVAKNNILPSKYHDNVKEIAGIDPLVKLANIRSKIFREDKQKDRDRFSLEDYCHLIYGWLVVNTTMISVLDYYDYPEENAPFIYTPDEVLEFDSDEIYNLLQERLTKMMMRKQIDRESTLAVLREKYGWERDETNLNLNGNGNFCFKFGENFAQVSENPEKTDETETENDKIDEDTDTTTDDVANTNE